MPYPPARRLSGLLGDPPLHLCQVAFFTIHVYPRLPFTYLTTCQDGACIAVKAPLGPAGFSTRAGKVNGHW